MEQGTSLSIAILAGQTLFDVAATQLGSPLQWINIAKMNSIVDPFFPNRTQIAIPLFSFAFFDGVGPQ